MKAPAGRDSRETGPDKPSRREFSPEEVPVSKSFRNALVSPPSTGKPASIKTGPAAYKPKHPQPPQGAGMKKGGTKPKC